MGKEHVHFNVCLGNPPYQENDGGGNGASARPVYQLFVEEAKKITDDSIVMITPSRWFSGGKGLDDFRDSMLSEERLKSISDYIEPADVFPNTSIKGGVSFFHWNKNYKGDCRVNEYNKGSLVSSMERPLLEEGCSTFIRFNEGVSIYRKVKRFGEVSFENLVSVRSPFGIPNTFKGRKKQNPDDVIIYISGNDRSVRGTSAYIPLKGIPKGIEMINWEKVYIGKAGSGSDKYPHPILPKPFYGAPNTICNESYLIIGPFENKEVCENVISYIQTKFFRFLVLLKKSSQNAARGVYELVPTQDFSEPWTDEKLYKKYDLSSHEIEFIESMIKEIE